VPALSLLPPVTVTRLAPLMLAQLALPVQQTALMIRLLVLLLVSLMLFLGAGFVAVHGAAQAVERQAPLPFAPQPALPQAVAAVLPAAQALLHVPGRQLLGRLPAAWLM
jgi:hypothetical protein